MVTIPNMMKGDVYMKSVFNTRRYFSGYGWLGSLSYDDYVFSLIYWVFEDDVDGYLIVSSVLTGEIRYVERDEK